MQDFLYESWMYIIALLPSAGLLYLFWVVMKHIVEGDRRERAALREWEAEQDRLAAARAEASTNDGTGMPQG